MAVFVLGYYSFFGLVLGSLVAWYQALQQLSSEDQVPAVVEALAALTRDVIGEQSSDPEGCNRWFTSAAAATGDAVVDPLWLIQVLMLAALGLYLFDS